MNTAITYFFLSFLFSFIFISSKGQNLIDHQQQKISSNGTKYLLYLPEGYSKETKTQWPLILFLHGVGESGNNLDKLKRQGIPKVLAEGKRLPFIIVSPQCRMFHIWDSEKLKVLLDEVISETNADENRIYLTGISLGGYGAWALATKYPEMFAALVPICGGGRKREAYKLKDIPTWIFHGAKDIVIPVSESIRMANALQKENSEVYLTIYPHKGHKSWELAYEEPLLFEWLIKQRKKKFNSSIIFSGKSFRNNSAEH